MQLLELARVIEEKCSIEEIWAALIEGLLPHRFEHLIYVTVDVDFNAPKLLTTMPELFIDSPPGEDPFLHWCCDSYEPTLTGAEFLPDHDYLPAAAKDFILRASEHGFRSGIAFPVRLTGSERFGGFNLGSRLSQVDFRKMVVEKIDSLRLLCLVAHRRIEELSRPPPEAVPGFRELMVAPAGQAGLLDDLTPREREVLFLIAQGFSRKECARMCTISVNTVSEYAKKAYGKLGLRNRAEAAALLATRPDLKP
ncbi:MULTISPECIES: LuxR family transcriptional regulator [unclassified Roseovarius]|uniref:helix-turn-helix transcriptional regulator n=1 Tax=unclassified Roseovarius TaxID=2614913 RepID=UPI00273F4D29|nr:MULTISPECIES: LuxR family transcriptional regulator [unclassified Roseovarius]